MRSHGAYSAYARHEDWQENGKSSTEA